MAVFTYWFGDKNLKTYGGIHWNRGFWWSCWPSAINSTKNPRFQWNHLRFQVLTPNQYVKPPFYCPSFTETVKKKKMCGFPLKPVVVTLKPGIFGGVDKNFVETTWNHKKFGRYQNPLLGCYSGFGQRGQICI